MDAFLIRLTALGNPWLWVPPLVGFAVFFAIEHLAPARPHHYRGALNSLRVGVVCSMIISPIVAIVPQMWVTQALVTVRQFSLMWPPPVNVRVLGFWWDAPSSPVGYVPSLTVIVVGAFIGWVIIDFFFYWFHRLQHTTFLWEQHKMHHSDRNFSVMTAYRGHWLEYTLQAFIITLPMGLLLNFTAFQTLVMATIIQQHGLFIHANLRLSFGILTPVICGPQLHRIHHSIEPHHQNKNFAVYFPIWDILFGTYCPPKKGEFAATGVQGEASIVTWDEMLWGPFRAWFGRRKLVDATGT